MDKNLAHSRRLVEKLVQVDDFRHRSRREASFGRVSHQSHELYGDTPDILRTVNTTRS